MRHECKDCGAIMWSSYVGTNAPLEARRGKKRTAQEMHELIRDQGEL